MEIKALLKLLTQIIYILCGLVSISTGIRGLKNEKAKIGTFLFWAILGIIFIFGPVIPYKVTGGLLVILAIITVTKQLHIGKFENISSQFKTPYANWCNCHFATTSCCTGCCIY